MTARRARKLRETCTDRGRGSFSPHPKGYPVNSPAPRLPPLGIAVALLCGAILPAGHAAKPVRTIQSVSSAPRDHHLFVGVEAYLTHDREMLEVRRFEGQQTVLQNDAGEQFVTSRDNGYQFKMHPKVSPIVIEIDDLKGQEAFSPWTDPTGQWMSRQVAFSGHFDDSMTNAARQLSAGMSEAHNMENAERGSGGPSPNTNYTSASVMSQAVGEFQRTQSALGSFNDTPEIVDRMNPVEKELEGTSFDAINLTFRIAAPEPIANAHALARVRIRNKAEGYQDISFQRELGAIGRNPRSVMLTLDGLPKGFEYVEADIHIFNQGVELATTRSERHMPLTAGEAREYLLLDHLAQHRGESTAAQPVWSLAPGALRSADDGGAYNFTALVDIDERGIAQAVKPLDGQILPESTRTLFREMTYLPALQDGEPIASTVQVNLADYFR